VLKLADFRTSAGVSVSNRALQVACLTNENGAAGQD
jgi:hypothetical protein